MMRPARIHHLMELASANILWVYEDRFVFSSASANAGEAWWTNILYRSLHSLMVICKRILEASF